MKLLAIDTSTEACSAALSIDGAMLWRWEWAPRRHAELILGMVDALLAEAGVAVQSLDALAFGRGPGAFTGIRIGTGVVQGIAFGADLPVIPVSTLRAIAQGLLRTEQVTQVAAAIDARMGEVYWGPCRVGDGGVMALAAEECVIRPELASVPDAGPWVGAGTGWGAYGEVLRDRLGDRVAGVRDEALPHAQDVAVLAIDDFARGLAVAAEAALPVYLRDRVAERPADTPGG